MSVILYSTDCPRCLVLERKLRQANIDFEKQLQFDAEKFIEQGFYSAPILEVDGELMKYTDAVSWVNDQIE